MKRRLLRSFHPLLLRISGLSHGDRSECTLNQIYGNFCWRIKTSSYVKTIKSDILCSLFPSSFLWNPPKCSKIAHSIAFFSVLCGSLDFARNIDDSCKFIDDSCFLLTKAVIVNKFLGKSLVRISPSATFAEKKKSTHENNRHIQPDERLPKPESFCKKSGGIFGSLE